MSQEQQLPCRRTDHCWCFLRSLSLWMRSVQVQGSITDVPIVMPQHRNQISIYHTLTHEIDSWPSVIRTAIAYIFTVPVAVCAIFVLAFVTCLDSFLDFDPSLQHVPGCGALAQFSPPGRQPTAEGAA